MLKRIKGESYPYALPFWEKNRWQALNKIPNGMAHLHQKILRCTHPSRILTLEIQFLKGGFQFFIIFLKNWYNCFVTFENQTRVTILFWIVSGIIYLMSQHKSDCFIKSTIFLVSEISVLTQNLFQVVFSCRTNKSKLWIIRNKKRMISAGVWPILN